MPIEFDPDHEGAPMMTQSDEIKYMEYIMRANVAEEKVKRQIEQIKIMRGALRQIAAIGRRENDGKVSYMYWGLIAQDTLEIVDGEKK